MFDSDINRLDQQAQSRSLEGLESAVWAKLEAQVSQTRAARTAAGWQAAILAVALISSVGAGARAATQLPVSGLGVFSPHAPLSPATLLGRH